MATQSFLFNFSRIDTFYENININFNIADMNGAENKFEFVLSSYTYDNIEECIDSNGGLKEEVITDEDYIVDCPLVWSNLDDGTNTISLATDVEWNFGDEIVPVKAVFLRDTTTGYVMGFSINMQPITVTNTLTFEADTILWTVSDGGYHG